jgi:aminotransferase
MELVPFSGIRKMFEKAKALEREGKDVILMETGRPDFDTPAHIKEAAKKALDLGHVHYTSNFGIPELRSAITDKLQKENGLDYNPDTDIIVTAGASEAVLDAFLAFVNPGDEVLFPEPSWLNYAAAARLTGAVPVPIPMREKAAFQIDPAEVESLITPKTKAMVIVSPHNPTGTVQHPDVVKALAQIAVRHNLLVISDEIYERIIFGSARHVSIASFAGMKERTIVINGFSKAYSMTGWRLGYLAAPAPLVQAMNRVHQYNTACANSFAQEGATAALRGPQDCVLQMVAEFSRRRDLVIGAFQSIKGMSCPTPEGAFYAFVNITGLGLSSEEFCTKLLEEANVSSVPGTVFGQAGDGYARFSYANSYERLEEAMRRIRKFAEKYAK